MSEVNKGRISPERRAPDTYEALQKAQKRESLFGRMSAAFQNVLQNSRGGNQRREPAVEAGDDPKVTADDLAIRRAKTVTAQRMIMPEGVIIEGSLTSGSETEISGRIEGDVTVEGRLYLGPSALVTGNVRATSCRIDGLVEGRMDCAREVELGPTARLNANIIAGRRVTIAGQIFGNITSGGMLRIAATAKVSGDVHVRQLIVEEGATFNGRCTMKFPADRSQP